MSKGINTIIEETKTELTDLINSKLKMGVPISVMGLIIDNVSNQIKPHVINAIKMESENSNSEQENNNEVKQESED